MAITLDGANCVDLGLDISGTGNQGFLAIAAWCRPTSVSGNQMVAGWSIGPPPGTAAAVRISVELNASSTGAITVRGRAADAETARTVNTGSSVFAADELFHVVGVIDYAASVHYIYKNGVLITSGSPASAYTQATTSNTNSKCGSIGARPLLDTLKYSGTIEDVRLYNRFISDAEAMTMYSLQGADGIVSGLLYRFPLAAAEGETVASPVIDLTGTKSAAPSGTAFVYSAGIITPRMRRPGAMAGPEI